MWEGIFSVQRRAPTSPREDEDPTARRYHRVEHGSCTYTFVLPDLDSCRAGQSRAASRQDALGRPAGSTVERLGRLEAAAKNNTAWLQKLESAMQEADRQQVWQAGSGPDPTVAMLELSTNLLSQTAEQTRKLSAMEGQVMQSMGIQHRVQHTTRLTAQGARQQADVQALRQEQVALGRLLSRQDVLIAQLQRQLALAAGNTSQLQQQQQELAESVHALLAALPHAAQQGSIHTEWLVYLECIYKVYRRGLECHRKMMGDTRPLCRHYLFQGFGEPGGEHWLGNEPVHQLSRTRPQQLRVELSDWAGSRAFSLYDRFGLASERLNYRLLIKGYSGTAGRFSSLGQNGLDFSTRDSDHDNCVCKCSHFATGGWWFDACGPSNLNGMYYPYEQHTGKFNGIKWHYWKGSSYSLKGTSMMIRPAGFQAR
uniref:Angiopoietin 2a n=1 Tax=Eptatretus burgeri TaxID=7764 RepID=A0A8C4QI62_EPTBU